MGDGRFDRGAAAARPVVVVTGIRDLDPASVPDVELAMAEAAAWAGTLRFGGASGADLSGARVHAPL